MTSKDIFPPLAGWKPTRQTLHLYSNILGVIPRAHAEPHPKWWHISLKVQPDGLVTDEIALPDGGTLILKMDLDRHQLRLKTSQGDEQSWSMTEGLSSTALGDKILGAVADLGLTGEYARQKFENDEPRSYDPAQAENFLTALVSANDVLETVRAKLSGEVGIVQLWPHGFDLAFEWFGTRVERYEHEGEVEEYPSQINFGFYPGEPFYFYSNPWPFEKDVLMKHPLPGGARWTEEGFAGTILPYAEVVGDPQAKERLVAYFQEVYRIASPTLLS